MKFFCTTHHLLQTLHLVSRAIGSQQALPILGSVLIVAEGKRCTVSATDLEISIVTSFEAKIENEGSITIPAKAILNFAQYNSDPDVLLETSEGTQLKCISEHAKTIIAGEAVSEYPAIAPVEKQSAFTIDASHLLLALDLVTFACARSALRPVLSGVYIRSEHGKLILVATDSYRLSEYVIPVQGGDVDISCIIPAKVLDELHAVLSSKRGNQKENEDEGEKQGGQRKGKPPPTNEVSVALSRQQIELTVGSTRLLSRLIDGKFPDYQQIIPKESITRVRFPVRELSIATRRMHYFAKEMNNNLTFHLKKKKAHISTPQTQVGKDEAELPVEIEGQENNIALSSSYILDFLSHTQSEEVEMQVTDNMHPAVFRMPKEKNFLHLIMPLRMQEE